MSRQRTKPTEQQSRWTDDAIVEPDNSTVDDWIGQRVERDAARAEEADAAAGGDPEEAERLFEQQTERRPGEPSTRDTSPH
jgi:hypothetical protein